MAVKLNANLPKGDGNGLAVVESDMVRDMKAFRVCISIVDCVETVTKADTGELIPKARIRRIEVVPDEYLQLAERIMRAALDKRLKAGQMSWGDELEAELAEAFPEVNPQTGEE